MSNCYKIYNVNKFLLNLHINGVDFIKSSKNTFIFILIVISGLIIGCFIGDMVKDIKFLGWLSYGKTIGLTSPLSINLEVITIQFSFTIKFTLSGIIGMIISILTYKKIS